MATSRPATRKPVAGFTPPGSRTSTRACLSRARYSGKTASYLSAYRLQEAGFTVKLREPDIVVNGNGLVRDVGIACKYPSSIKQIQDHISKGYRQLTKQNLPGVVAFGMDLLVFRAAFKHPPHYLDFRQNAKHPMQVAQKQLQNEVIELIEARSKYPAELPLDGAMLSLAMWGAYHEPVRITEVAAWTFQCDSANPLRQEIGILVSALTQASARLGP